MKKFVVPALFALTTLASSAHAATVGDFGSQLQKASDRINEILAGAPDEGQDPSTGSQAGTTDPIGTVGSETGSESGSDGSVWGQEDDKKAVPIYLRSATALGDAGSSFIQAQVADAAGNYPLATLKQTQACARVNIALADLATANYLAAQPGFYMYLQAFGPELTELLKDIKLNRGVYCP